MKAIEDELEDMEIDLRNLITLCQSLPEIENEIKNNYAHWF
jgi:hypothetical protein